MAQQGVDKILRSKFTPLSFKGFILCEVQAFFNFEGVSDAVSRNLRHGFCGIGHDLSGHGHPVVSQKWLKNSRSDGV